MDFELVAKQIVECLGGKENLQEVNNCMTRLRIKVYDESKVDFVKLESNKEVIKVLREDTIQIVVGLGKSSKIAEFIKSDNTSSNANVGDWEANKKNIASKNNTSLKGNLKKIGNIFVPLIPAIVAAGLLNGIAGYFQNSYTMSQTALPMWLLFMQTLGAGLFSYFVIYVGINAAKEFGATPGLGGIIGAITISPNINIFSKQLGLLNETTPLNSILTTGKGGIIGVILGVIILAYVEKKLRKVIPAMLETIFTPLLSLIIVGAITIFVIMPIAGVFSDYLIKILGALIMAQGILSIVSGFVLAAVFLPLVVVGLHQGLIPFYMVQLQQYGSIPLYPILAMAGAGQVGAAYAIYLKAKSHGKLREIIKGALPVGILGVGEPLIYGVTLPLGRPFLTAALGGGVGGAICAFTGVASVAFGPSGITAIPLIIPSKILFYIVGLIFGYIFGFIFTYFFGIPKNLSDFD